MLPLPPRPLIVLAVVAGSGLLPAAAPAQTATFAPAQQVGTGAATTTAAAISAGGAAVVPYVVRRGERSDLLAMTRARADAAWHGPVTLHRGATTIRDVQAAVGPDDRLLVAWAEATTSRGSRVRMADVSSGAPDVVADRSVRSAWGASPRLAVTQFGRVMLAWRDGRTPATSVLRVAVLAPGAEALGSSRRLTSGLSSLAITMAGGGATVGWLEPYSPSDRTRELWTRRLDNGGTPREAAFLVSHDAAPGFRLSGTTGARALASWLRPRTADRPAAGFTRALYPRQRPAQPLLPPGAPVPRRAASLAGEPDRLETFLSAVDAADPARGFSVIAAVSRFGSVWTLRRTLTPAEAVVPMVGAPRALRAADGLGAVVWSEAVPTPAGTPAYAVRVATGASGATPSDVVTVGAGLVTTDGAGVSAATGGARVVVAWPAAAGGVHVVEREP